MFFQGAIYQKSQSAMSTVPKMVLLRLSSKQSVGDVWIAQVNR